VAVTAAVVAETVEDGKALATGFHASATPEPVVARRRGLVSVKQVWALELVATQGWGPAESGQRQHCRFQAAGRESYASPV